MASSLRGYTKRIIDLYTNGLSTRKIADILGRTSNAGIRKIVKQAGLIRSNLEWQSDKHRKQEACQKTSDKRKGIPQPKARKHSIDTNLFKSLEDPFVCYLLGVLVTDGHVGDRHFGIMVSQEDSTWMKLISKRLNVPLKFDNRGYPYLTYNSIEVVSTLRELGLNKDKTKNPQLIIIPKLENDFLRGLIDGDGSVVLDNKNRPSIYFGNTNKQLVDWVQLKFNRKGSKCKSYLVNERNYNKTAKRPYQLPFYSVCCSGESAALLLEDIYYNKCFALPRKIKKAKEGMKWRRSDSWRQKRY